MQTGHPLLDWEQLDMIADGFPPDFVEIYREFEQDFPRILDMVRAGLNAGDATQVARAAHQAKGSCANFGFIAVSQATSQIEKTAKTGSLDGLMAKLAEAEVFFRDSVALVRRERGV